MDACNLSYVDGTGNGSGEWTSMNKNSFTILFINFCVSDIVEVMGLLLVVCRLYSDDGVSTCGTEWDSAYIAISFVTSFTVNEGLSVLGLFLILPLSKRFSIRILRNSLETLRKFGMLMIFLWILFCALMMLFNISDDCYNIMIEVY